MLARLPLAGFGSRLLGYPYYSISIPIQRLSPLTGLFRSRNGLLSSLADYSNFVLYRAYLVTPFITM